MTKEKGRIALGTLLILLLLPIVVVAAYLLKNQVEKPAGKKPAIVSPKPPALQALIDPAIAEALPGAQQVVIVSDNDMYMEYIPEDDVFGVTIINPPREAFVKETMPLYFKALGVEDFDSVKIDYRVKLDFSQE